MIKAKSPRLPQTTRLLPILFILILSLCNEGRKRIISIKFLFPFNHYKVVCRLFFLLFHPFFYALILVRIFFGQDFDEIQIRENLSYISILLKSILTQLSLFSLFCLSPSHLLFYSFCIYLTILEMKPSLNVYFSLSFSNSKRDVTMNFPLFLPCSFHSLYCFYTLIFMIFT